MLIVPSEETAPFYLGYGNYRLPTNNPNLFDNNKLFLGAAKLLAEENPDKVFSVNFLGQIEVEGPNYTSIHKVLTLERFLYPGILESKLSSTVDYGVATAVKALLERLYFPGIYKYAHNPAYYKDTAYYVRHVSSLLQCSRLIDPFMGITWQTDMPIKPVQVLQAKYLTSANSKDYSGLTSLEKLVAILQGEKPISEGDFRIDERGFMMAETLPHRRFCDPYPVSITRTAQATWAKLVSCYKYSKKEPGIQVIDSSAEDFIFLAKTWHQLTNYSSTAMLNVDGWIYEMGNDGYFRKIQEFIWLNP
jgi:hypothetical protein